MRAVARSTAEASRRAHGDHASPEDLLAYAADEAPPQLVEAVQEHLAACPACARAVLDLRAFPDVVPTGGVGRLSDAEVDAAWRRLRPEAGRPGPHADRSEPAAGRPGRARWWSWLASPALAPAAAAALLVAAIGLGGWALALRERVAELSRPRINVAVADLIPGGAQERGAAVEVRLPADARHVLLLLHLADLRTFPAYRLTITDAEGRELWSGHASRRTREGNFTVEIDRRLLPAGEVRVAVHGVADGRGELLAEYAFELRPEPPGAGGGR